MTAPQRIEKFYVDIAALNVLSSRTLSVPEMLAGGEHAPSLKYASETWLLPVPKIVGNDQALHNQLLRCHACVNELIAGRLSRLRDLTATRTPARCQVPVAGAIGAVVAPVSCDAHELLRFDAHLRRLEAVVDVFVAQWTMRVRRWTYEMPEAEYRREANALFETVVRFKESLQSVERQLQSGGRALERYLGRLNAQQPQQLLPPPQPPPLAPWTPAALARRRPTALWLMARRVDLAHSLNELAKSAAICGGVWFLFGVGAYFSSYINDRLS